MYKSYIVVNIRKPIFANYCGIRELYIRQAQKYHKDLKVITPNGIGIVSPTKFLQGAERIEKVFLIPDRPMVLYANHVKVDPIESEKPTVEDYIIPNAVRERLRERALELGFYKRAGI
jgi:hypothetical protein